MTAGLGEVIVTSVRVHLCWSPDAERSLAGGVVVVHDLIRASTTMVRALANGARRVVPCMEPEDARAAAEAEAGSIVGGERGGLALPGFDLGNSPDDYTPQRVNAATVYFTTTNGTRAILRARAAGASAVFIGALSNRAAVCRALMQSKAEHIHLLCAGIQDRVCLDDTIAAGAYATLLHEMGAAVAAVQDDSTLLAMDAFALAAGRNAAAAAKSSASALEQALLRTQGGRNLVEIGLENDLAACAAIDTCEVLARVEDEHGVLAVKAAKGAVRE